MNAAAAPLPISDSSHAEPKTSPSADIGRRFLAGVLDLFALTCFGALFSLSPLLYSGAALPMIGALAAITAWAITPATLFGATPGMALVGLRIETLDGTRPDATEIAFRELVGRGLIGFAYFGTAAIGLAGLLSGYLQFFLPTGLGLFFFALSGLLVAFSALSHLMALVRPDGRALHDLMAHTRVVARAPAAPVVPVELDEDAAAFANSGRRGRLRSFVVSEMLLAGLAFGLPYLISRPVDGAAKLEDRVALAKAEKAFAKDQTDPEAAAELAAIQRAAGKNDAAEKIERQHRDALKAAGLEPSDRDYQVQKYRALLKGTPCALGSAVALGDRLNQLGAYTKALAEVERYEAACEPQPRLWWVSVHAHRELGQSELAIADATRLIADRPADSDFWWWRGEDYQKAGDRLRAESDFRQSLAVSADRFAAKRFIGLVHETDRCEAQRALIHLRSENPDAAGRWTEGLEPSLAGDCATSDGKGKVTLKIGRDGSVPANVEIGGKKGHFLVHSTGYVTISQAFADKVGLSADSHTEISVRVGERVLPAHLARAAKISVGASRAEQVPVAIVDALPAEADGLLGLSYLWRFRIERNERSLTLTAP